MFPAHLQPVASVFVLLAQADEPGSSENIQSTGMSSSPVFGLNSKRSLCGFPFQRQLRKGFVATLSGQKHQGALNSDLCACLCLFNAIICSLTAIRLKGAQCLQRGLPLSQTAEVGLCHLAWRPKEPPLRLKPLPTKDIIAMGLTLCPGPDPHLGRVLRGLSCTPAFFSSPNTVRGREAETGVWIEL